MDKAPEIGPAVTPALRKTGPRRSPLFNHSGLNRPDSLLIACCVATITSFLFFGVLLIPLLGLQTDEVMFVHALWVPKGGVAWFSFFHHYYPSMMMSYLGALKSWLYAPLLAFFPVSVWTVRLPALLAAALTIVLVGLLLRHIHGATAAILGIALLGTNPVFLSTATFDWGPVVLQNLLLVVLLLLVLEWHRNPRGLVLFAAGLVTGLALWNKALFVWNLSGLVVALLLVAFDTVRRIWNVRVTGIFTLGLLLGAYPLLRYNLKNHGTTISQNAHLTLADAARKVQSMVSTLDGEGAHGAFVDLGNKARDQVRRPFGTLSIALARYTGSKVSTFLLPLGAISIAAALVFGEPLQRRWIGFFLISGVIAWAESVLTVNAGLSIHHTDLFLVQSYCAIAISGAVLANYRPKLLRPAVVAVTLFVCVRALSATDAVYAEIISHDALVPWTNAEKPMIARLLQSGVKRIITIDWGISDVVTARTGNQIAVDGQPLALMNGRFDAPRFLACKSPECAIVGHVAPAYSMAAAERTFDTSLTAAHLVKTDAEVFSDTHGVPTLCTFRIGKPSD